MVCVIIVNDLIRFIEDNHIFHQSFFFLNIIYYYIPINVLLKIQAVPSSGIQTSGSHFPYHHCDFPYHHSVIFRIRIMLVWRVNFNNMPKICWTTFVQYAENMSNYFLYSMPKICRTTFCTKEDRQALHKQLEVIQPSGSTHCSGILYIFHRVMTS